MSSINSGLTDHVAGGPKINQAQITLKLSDRNVMTLPKAIKRRVLRSLFETRVGINACLHKTLKRYAHQAINRADETQVATLHYTLGSSPLKSRLEINLTLEDLDLAQGEINRCLAPVKRRLSTIELKRAQIISLELFLH